MSFGRDIAAGCAEQEIKVLVFQLIVAVALGAGGIWLLKSFGYSDYNITRDDIEMLKDAAAAIGPGDPIARELWRLAERAEGK
jgi:ABC-type transporter Mla subunit MlaD